MKMKSILLATVLLFVPVFLQAQSNKDLLAGPWQKIDEPGKLMIFRGEDLFVSYDNAQFHWKCRYDEKVIKLSDVWGWSEEFPYEIKDGMLTVPFKFADGTFRRLENTPPELLTEPLELGNEKIGSDELATMKAELADRLKKDQEVRALLNVVLTSEKKDKAEEERILKEMATVDKSNKEWLIETISKYGWIDSERFGKEGTAAAFFIVQHSQYLPLMRAALPELKKEAEKGNISGNGYALLYDRTALKLGKKQRYGSQINLVGGSPRLAPVEDFENVDKYRAELGLGPLSERLEMIEKQFGKQVEVIK